MRYFMHSPDTEKSIENNFVEEIKENKLQGRSIYT